MKFLGENKRIFRSDWSVMFVVFLLYAFNAVYIGFLITTFTQSGMIIFLELIVESSNPV